MTPSFLHPYARAMVPMLVVLVVVAATGCQAFISVRGAAFGNQLQPRDATTHSTKVFASSSSSSSSSSAPQVLEFREPTTGVLVKLVGCMHYNPSSIQLTEDTINELGRDNRLGSVIIESCDIRWNQTTAFAPPIKALLQSEMKAACDLATDQYQRPVVLGDQRINLTVASMKQGLKETFTDLSTPLKGGWGRYWRNVTLAREEALPFGRASGDGTPYLNPLAFLDPRLLLGFPVSLIKYPLSYFFKAPLQTTAFFALLFAIDQPPSGAATLLNSMDMDTLNTLVSTSATATNAEIVKDWVATLAVSGLEIAFFARLFLKDLLVERNKLLARNILEQCKLYQSTTTTTTASPTPFWATLFGGKQAKLNDIEIVYAEGPAGTVPRNNPGDDKAVVAVLGMAHCNGIMKLLQDQEV